MRALLAAILLCACSSSTSPQIGSACAKSGDCGDGQSCFDGICSLACNASSICPDAATCTPLETSLGASLCLPTCINDAACKTGFACCSSLENVCVPAAQCPAVGGNGAACTSNASCATGSVCCASQGNICAPQGQCQPTSVGTSTSCDPPTVTSGGVAGPSAKPATCQKPVITSALSVQALGAFQVGSTAHFNVPAGTGTISILQQVIDGSAPDTFTYQGGSEPNAVVPLTVTSPSGVTYYDDDVQGGDDSAREAFFGLPEAATAALTIPNTSQGLTHEDGGYETGSWSLVVNDYAYECTSDPAVKGQCDGGASSQKYDIQVVTRPIAGATGLIDVGIYLVSTKWTAAQAMVSPAWQRFQSTLGALYANAGICIHSFILYDVPGWAKSAYATSVDVTKTSPCDAFSQLLTLSQAGNELPLFFVDDLEASGSNSGGTIVGLDGAIPGPPGAGGTVHSGAVVNVSDIASGSGCTGAPALQTCGADSTAYIAAHEGGHFMGLYHPSELSGTSFDPLDDTPECAQTCDVNHDGVVGGSECANDSATTGVCGGGDYLMFWQFSNTSKGKISTEEARVIRASPAVR